MKSKHALVVLLALASCGGRRLSPPAQVGHVVAPDAGGALVTASEPTSLGLVYDGCAPSAAPAAPSAGSQAATLVLQSADSGIAGVSVLFSPDKRLVATNDGRTVRLWDPNTGELRGILSDPLASFASQVAFAPDGATLAVSGEHVVLWDLTTGSVRARLATVGYANAVVWSAAGDAVGAITIAGSMHVWNARDGSVRASGRLVLPAGWHGVYHATISADGSRVIIRSVQNALAVAAFPASGAATLLDEEDARALAAREVSDAVIARMCGGGTWDAASLTRGARTPMGARSAFAMSSRDASRLLAVSEEGLPVVWDVPRGQVLSTPEGTPFRHGAEDFLPENDRFELSDDGSRVQGITVAPGAHGWEFNYTVRVWSARTGRLESKQTVSGSGVVVHASRDGSKRVFLSKPYYLDPGYRLFVGGVPAALVAALARDRRLVFDAGWSTDGSRLTVTRARTSPDHSDDVVHEIWDVASGRRVSTPTNVDEKSGPRFVSEEDSGTIRVVRQSDAAWMTLTPLFGPHGPELVVESSTGEIDVSPSTSSLVRFRVGSDLRTSPMVAASDPRVRDQVAGRFHRSLASDFLR